MNRKYFLQASSISVHAEQGGDSRTATTGLVLATGPVNCARKENTLYFKSQHTQPADSAQKRTTGISGSRKRDYWRRKSCMKNPGAKNKIQEKFLPCLRTTPSKLLCMKYYLFTETWSPPFLPHNICGRRT